MYGKEEIVTKNFIELKEINWILKVHRVLKWCTLTQDKQILKVEALQRSLRTPNIGENSESLLSEKAEEKADHVQI